MPRVPLPPPVPRDDHGHHGGGGGQGQGRGPGPVACNAVEVDQDSVAGSASALVRVSQNARPNVIMSPVVMSTPVRHSFNVSHDYRQVRHPSNNAEHSHQGSAGVEHRQTNSVSSVSRQQGPRGPPPPYWSIGPPAYTSVIRSAPPPPFQEDNRVREVQNPVEHITIGNDGGSRVQLRQPVMPDGDQHGEERLVPRGLPQQGNQGGGLSDGAGVGNGRGVMDGRGDQGLQQGVVGGMCPRCPPPHEHSVTSAGQGHFSSRPIENNEENVQTRKDATERNVQTQLRHETHPRQPPSRPQSVLLSTGHVIPAGQGDLERRRDETEQVIPPRGSQVPRVEERNLRPPHVLDEQHPREGAGHHGARGGHTQSSGNRGSHANNSDKASDKLEDRVLVSQAGGKTGNSVRGQSYSRGGNNNGRRQSGACREPETDKGGADSHNRESSDKPQSVVSQERGSDGRRGGDSNGRKGNQSHGAGESVEDTESIGSSTKSVLIESTISKTKKKKLKKKDKQTANTNLQKVSPEKEKNSSEQRTTLIQETENVVLTEPPERQLSAAEEININEPASERPHSQLQRLSSGAVSSSSPISVRETDSLTQVLSQHSGDREIIQRELDHSHDVRNTVTDLHARMSSTHTQINEIIQGHLRSESTEDGALLQLEAVTAYLGKMEEEVGRRSLGPQISLSLYSSLLETKKMVSYARTMFNKRRMNAARVAAEAASQRREQDRLAEQIRHEEAEHEFLVEQGRQRHLQRLAEARVPARRQQELFTPGETLGLRVGGYGGLLGNTGFTPGTTDWSFTEEENVNTSLSLPLPGFSPQHNNTDDDNDFADSRLENIVRSDAPVSGQVLSDTSLLGNVLLLHKPESNNTRMSISDEIQQASGAEAASRGGDVTNTTVTLTNTTASPTQRQAEINVQNESTGSMAADNAGVDGLIGDGHFGGQVWGAAAALQPVVTSSGDPPTLPGELMC